MNLQRYSRKDSAIVTKNPVAINTSEIDSLFISADTLYSVGDRENRIIKGLNNVKFLKKYEEIDLFSCNEED